MDRPAGRSMFALWSPLASRVGLGFSPFPTPRAPAAFSSAEGEGESEPSRRSASRVCGRLRRRRVVTCERWHMKYWIDTEFIERPCTIDLISVGLVAEDGREFYAESSEVDWTKAGVWNSSNRPAATQRFGNVTRRNRLRRSSVCRSGRAPDFLGLFSRLRLGRVLLAVWRHERAAVSVPATLPRRQTVGHRVG